METKIVNVKITSGDIVTIEHTSVDERVYIEAVVSLCNIKDGNGIAIFHDADGKVYTWRPSDSPHGEVELIDKLQTTTLINPYVRAFSTEVDKFRPVDSYSGEYSISVKI